jgi:hypothetical protein
MIVPGNATENRGETTKEMKKSSKIIGFFDGRRAGNNDAGGTHS